MKKGILGRKIGMTEKFTTDGKVIPVTVVEVEPNVIMQIKTVETDGYNAIQLAIVDKKEKNASKAAIGHAKKAGVSPKRFLKELRVESTEGYTLGSTIAADTFEVGEKVDVTGTSKGKGFQGVIKRHGQSRGPETHGSHYHRRPGSMGTMRPMRVLKGKKNSGHMGAETVTIQNLEIIEVCVEDNYILVSGNIPGPKNGLVLIRSAAKGGKAEPKEIIINKPETVVDAVEDVVEESTSEVTSETETQEVVEEATDETTEETTEEVKEETTDDSTLEATETNETVEESTEE